MSERGALLADRPGSSMQEYTLGTYLAARLEQAGLQHYFAVPGDYNLALLDELNKNTNLQMINCCNELNAGYAADGYARAHGLAALVVTYCVGGLSAINAVAGSFSEDLPVIVISGAPGSDAAALHQHLHHTPGNIGYTFVSEMYAKITANAVIINDPEEAPRLIDHAINTAIRTRKPVYLDIACNLSLFPIGAPQPFELSNLTESNPDALQAAVSHAAELLNKAVKPVLVGGVKLRSFNAIDEFEQLAATSQYAVAAMPNAKGFVSEELANFIGIYWGGVSSAGCCEIVESSDLVLFAGPVFSDYTTTGYSSLLNPKKIISAEEDHVKVGGQVYNNVFLADFLKILATKITSNNKSFLAYSRIAGQAPLDPLETDPKAKLSTRSLFFQIQQVLDDDITVLAETGDSWFNTMQLKLPKGCGYEIQMQYGSIGWAVGAAMGYAAAKQGKKRVIACIGDGSFQISAQEVSTMIRYGLNPIIILINNRGYTIEVEIHDGPYNNIKNWNYSQLVEVFNAEDGKGKSWQAKTEAEFKVALKEALKHDSLSFIEVFIDRDDCNKHLLEWGSRVAANNSKPPLYNVSELDS